MVVKIRKIGVATNAGFRAANWPAMVAGEKPPEGQSMPVDYEIEGTLLAPIIPGQQIIVFRHDRNGVPALGLFCTSPVEEIVVVTQNSVYRVSALNIQPTDTPN
jgi:hypothetical protein